MATPDAAGRAGLLGQGALVGAAMLTTNVCTYAYTLVLARTLPREDFGVAMAVLGLMVVGSVAAVTLQAVVARRVAVAAAGDVPALARVLSTSTHRVGLAVGAGAVAAAPVVAALLRTELTWALAVGLGALGPLTVHGGLLGVLQGATRWAALSLGYLAMGVGRILIGGVTVALRPDLVGAFGGLALASVVPWLVAELLVHRAVRPVRERPPRWAGAAVAPEILHAGLALLGMFLLANVDVVLARRMLTPDEAGIYAAGAILAKAAFFLPQVITTLAYPRMARSGRSTLGAAALVALVGVTASAVVAALPGLAITFVGGLRFAALSPDAWRFVAAGSALALAHLLLYGRLAQQDRRAAATVWAAVAVLVVAISVLGDSVRSIVNCTLVVASLLAVFGVAAAWSRDRTQATRPMG